MKNGIRRFSDLEAGSLVRAICETSGDHEVTAWGIKAIHSTSDGSANEEGIFWIPEARETELTCRFELGFSGDVFFVSHHFHLGVELGHSQLFRNLDVLIESGGLGPVMLGAPALLGGSIDQRGQEHGPVVCSLDGEIRRYIPGKPLHDGACMLFPEPIIHPSDEDSCIFFN